MKIHMQDLLRESVLLEAARAVVRDLVASGGSVSFVGSEPRAAWSIADAVHEGLQAR